MDYKSQSRVDNVLRGKYLHESLSDYAKVSFANRAGAIVEHHRAKRLTVTFFFFYYRDTRREYLIEQRMHEMAARNDEAGIDSCICRFALRSHRADGCPIFTTLLFPFPGISGAALSASTLDRAPPIDKAHSLVPISLVSAGDMIANISESRSERDAVFT